MGTVGIQNVFPSLRAVISEVPPRKFKPNVIHNIVKMFMVNTDVTSGFGFCYHAYVVCEVSLIETARERVLDSCQYIILLLLMP